MVWPILGLSMYAYCTRFRVRPWDHESCNLTVRLLRCESRSGATAAYRSSSRSVESSRLRPVSFRQAVVLWRFDVWHLLQRFEKIFPATTLGSQFEIALITPDPNGLSHCQANELLKRNLFALSQLLRLFEDRFRDFGFDRGHDASLNLASICAGVIASRPKASTPAKSRKLCVTIYCAFAATANSRMKSSAGSDRNGRQRKLILCSWALAHR